MYEEIAAFIREHAARIKEEEEWQEGDDPNDHAARSALGGEWYTLRLLADRFGIPLDD